MTHLVIVGAGMGEVQLLTEQAGAALQQAKEILAFGRIGELMQTRYPSITVVSYQTLLQRLEEGVAEKTAVLVSGDVGFFSMATTLQQRFADRYELELVCGLNCLQYFASKVGRRYDQATVLSLHGRNSVWQLLGSVTHQSDCFVLTGGANNAKNLLQTLSEYLPETVTVTAGQNLSMAEERIQSGSVQELMEREYDDLTVLWFHNPTPAKATTHYRDEAFTRTTVPMSKREVRNLSVDFLDIQPTDVVYDIGGGTGSVSIELANHAHQGVVFSIEKNPVAYDTLCGNRQKFGAWNMVPVAGKGEEILDNLPTPTKVFIGGSSGALDQMVDKLVARNPSVEFLINAVTLETLCQTVELFKARGFDFSVTTIQGSYSRKLKNYHLMTANNPVYLLWGKQDETAD